MTGTPLGTCFQAEAVGRLSGRLPRRIKFSPAAMPKLFQQGRHLPLGLAEAFRMLFLSSFPSPTPRNTRTRGRSTAHFLNVCGAPARDHQRADASSIAGCGEDWQRLRQFVHEIRTRLTANLGNFTAAPI